MTASIIFNKIQRPYYKKRYIFVDKEGIYYFWQFMFSEFLVELEIIPFRLEEGKFVETDTNKLDELVKYLKLRLLNKTESQMQDFLEYINSLEFNVPKSIQKKFGDEFCLFLRDNDNEFIYKDPNAKHWIIDFEKIRNNEQDFLKEPDLLPFTITELGVTLTKNEELIKDGNKISIEEFWKVREKYKTNLIPIIQRKDEIFKKIELNLEKRFFESLKEIESKKIFDYEIDATIEVYDAAIEECYEPILNIFYTDLIFQDKEPYSLSLYGLNLRVSRICWYLIDSLGLKAIEQEFYFWSDIEVKNQMFFRL